MPPVISRVDANVHAVLRFGVGGPVPVAVRLDMKRRIVVLWKGFEMTAPRTRRAARPAPLAWLTQSARELLLAVCVIGLPGAAVAQDAVAPDSDGPSSILETYRDWVVRCDSAEGAPRRCEMAQELRQADGRLVFATLVQRTGTEDAAVVFVAPFGVALAEGLRFQWADASVWDVPFATCYATGCIAERAADQADLARMQDAASVPVAMQAFGGDRVELTLSLAGFTGAWRRLAVLAAEQTAP